LETLLIEREERQRERERERERENVKYFCTEIKMYRMETIRAIIMQIAEQLSLKASSLYVYIMPVNSRLSRCAACQIDTKHYQRLSRYQEVLVDRMASKSP